MCNNNCSNCNCSNNCGEYSNFGIQRLSSPAEKSTGDSRAIRIGNDIKLDVTIQELTGMDIINIKSIKCFIINTTPMLQDHRGTAYEIRRCGFPHYYAHPFEEYHGFGVYPGFPKNWHYNLFPRPYYDFYHKYYGCHYLKPIHRHNKPFEFIAPVKALEDRNKVRVFFPATAQMLCGLYSLTFVIDLYEPGYHQNNLRTVTVDYNNVFELVPNAEGRSGDIIIDIDKQIGLNVYDNNMFGNTTQTIQQQEDPAKIQEIQISGDNDILVGQFKTYTAVCAPSNSTSIEWKVIGEQDSVIISSIGNNRVAVFAKKIGNAFEGKSVVTLQCSATDGSNVFAEKNITIHNYATSIAFTGSTLVPYGESTTGTLSIQQEDGTKISLCERGCECQSINILGIEVIEGAQYCNVSFGAQSNITDCTWDFDESSETNSATNSSSCGCPNDLLIITNNPNHADTQRVSIKITGNAKKQDGSFVETILYFDLNGSSSTEQANEEDKIDKYIVDGGYRDGHITLTNADPAVEPLTIDISSLQNENAEYWYDATVNN